MTATTAKRVSGILLAVLVAGAAYAARNLHRNGHLTGDDFALYLNQARAIFEGNVAQVITDNRFLWQRSAGVTPQMYPWGFPLLLAPFVRLWGIAGYDKLKLVEVACLCGWLVLFHGIVRRRAGRVVALAVTAVFATAPVYLVQTDQLLTEFPHMLATATVIWWLDRVMQRQRLTCASVRDLVIVGLLVTMAYNVRRESLALVVVIAAAQLVDLVGRGREAPRIPPPPSAPPTQFWGSRVGSWLRALPWRALALPYVAFAATAVVAQMLLPSTLVPDNGNTFGNIDDRLFSTDQNKPRDLPFELPNALGLGARPLLGLVLLALAAAGAVVACARKPRLNVPLAALAVATMAIVGTHIRMVPRYYYQVIPILVYFIVMLAVSYGEMLVDRARRLGHVPSAGGRRALLAVLAAPAIYVAAIHVWSLPSKIDSADRYNASGQVQWGGLTNKTKPAFEAVERFTKPDDVIVFYRARSLNLYTGRRGVQTTTQWKVERYADYFLQGLTLSPGNYSQPRSSTAGPTIVAGVDELSALGWTIVWENEDWRLWKVDGPAPDPAAATTTATATATAATTTTTTVATSPFP